MQRKIRLTPVRLLVLGYLSVIIIGTLLLIIPFSSKITGSASFMVIAKVTRDREMAELDLLFPEYGFAQHKGYPTALHMEKLTQFGATPHHRRSFAPVRNALIDADVLAARQPTTL